MTTRGHTGLPRDGGLCIACKLAIELGATKCGNCGEYQQSGIWRHVGNGLSVLSLLVAALSVTTLLVSNWDLVLPDDSELGGVVLKAEINEEMGLSKGELIPAANEPVAGVWAVVMIANDGERSGAIMDVGTKTKAGFGYTTVKDFLSSNGTTAPREATFPATIPKGESRVYYVLVGIVRKAGMKDRTATEWKELVKRAPELDNSMKLHTDAGWDLKDGIDLALEPLRVSFMSHRGILQDDAEIRVSEEQLVDALRNGPSGPFRSSPFD